MPRHSQLTRLLAALSVSWSSTTVQAFSSKQRFSPVLAAVHQGRSFRSQAAAKSGSSDDTHSSMETITTSTLNEKFQDLLDLHCINGPIGSTQDETKRLLANLSETKNGASGKLALAVLASQQENGRGTQGRKWEGKRGNVYLTVVIPLDRVPVTITLLPLQIGVLIAQTLQRFLPATTPSQKDSENPYRPSIVVKWPNDVLVDDGKIAGVLIENWISPSSNDCWLLIGVGINVAFAPSLPSGVREATCLQDCCDKHRNSTNHKQSTETGEEERIALPDDTSRRMALTLVQGLLDWMMNTKGDSKSTLETRVLQEFRSWAEFDQIYKIRETGEEVTTLDIQPDGQLKVRGADGQERDLVADYLF